MFEPSICERWSKASTARPGTEEEVADDDEEEENDDAGCGSFWKDEKGAWVQKWARVAAVGGRQGVTVRRSRSVTMESKSLPNANDLTY